MMRSLSPPALANLLLAAGLVAVGASSVPGSFLRLPSHATVATLERGRAVDRADLDRARQDLEAAVAASNGARADLAFVLLAGGAGEAEAERVAGEFRIYLAEVPGDARVWAGLAQAELLRGRRAEAVRALKASILTGPSSSNLVLWRCGVGIDLYDALDEEGRRLVAGQMRMAVERSVDRLVPLVRQKNAALIALALLSGSPEAAQTFTDHLIRIQQP